jgi:hypothetical protein
MAGLRAVMLSVAAVATCVLLLSVGSFVPVLKVEAADLASSSTAAATIFDAPYKATTDSEAADAAEQLTATLSAIRFDSSAIEQETGLNEVRAMLPVAALGSPLLRHHAR